MHHSEETEKLLNRAEECRVLAQVATDEQARFAYLSLAEAYETLAKQQQVLYVTNTVAQALGKQRRRA